MKFKKLLMLGMFFVAAVCLLSAGFYINREEAGMQDSQTTQIKKREPELLSDIDLASYASLPAAFEAVTISETSENVKITQDNVEEVMYKQLFATASHPDTIEAGCSIKVDFSLTQNGQISDRETGYIIGYDTNNMSQNVYDALKDKGVGATIHVEDATFAGKGSGIVDISVSDIYGMPYPVTDKYVAQNTEYASVSDMEAKLIQNAESTVRQQTREQTLSGLIDAMMKQSTFVTAPDSLTIKELEVLKKDNPDATYSDAQHSFYRLAFIAAMLKKYDIADASEMERRYAALPQEKRDNYTQYEAEREKYLLFEDDVTNYIYRKVQIASDETETATEVGNTSGPLETETAATEYERGPQTDAVETENTAFWGTES